MSLRDSSRRDGVIDPTLADTELATDAGPRPRHRSRPLQEGDRVARYRIEKTLGAGAMGVVYLARDPELDRPVALKLLHGNERSEARQRRLVREAQALARLSHPNVVRVLDAGRSGGRVYIAMEYVVGATLAVWLAKQATDWRPIVDRFLEIARGLAAAHAAGLVHRDFKPDNVLVGEDGRPRIVDFGLALDPTRVREGDVLPEPSSESHTPGSRDELQSQLTREGATVGTPAYMAPEQHLGASTDGRTDQFAFCVALFEAIYGARPFHGRTMVELADAVIEGDLRLPSSDRGIPMRVQRVLERGLRTDPGQRFASMEDLAVALRTAVRRRSMPWVVAGAGAAALVGWLVLRPTDPPQCDFRGTPVLDEDRAQRMREHFTTQTAYGGPVFDRVESRILAQGSAIQWMRHQSCEATRVDGRQTEAEMDLRGDCLDRRLAELRALIRVLEGASAATIEDADGLVDGLVDVEECRNVVRLRAGASLPDDPDARQKYQQIFEALEHAAGQASVGEIEAAQATRDSLAKDVAAIDHPALRARLARLDGWIAEARGDRDAYRQQLQLSWNEATAARDDRLALSMAGALARVTAVERDEAATERWIGAMRGAATRVDSRRATVEATRLEVAAWAELGRFDAAEQALVRLASEASELPSAMAQYDCLAGAVLGMQGKLKMARLSLRRCVTSTEETRGEDHPDLATALSNLAAAQAATGQGAEARVHLERAVRVYEAARGPEHTDVAWGLLNLAAVIGNEGDLEAAEPILQRAAGIFERAQGPEGRETLRARSNLAALLFDAGRLDEAEGVATAVIESIEHARGHEDPDLTMPLIIRARALARRDKARAKTLVERALGLARKHGTESSPRVAHALGIAAFIEALDGAPGSVIPRLRDALGQLLEIEGKGSVAAMVMRADLVALLEVAGRPEAAASELSRLQRDANDDARVTRFLHTARSTVAAHLDAAPDDDE